ncbi:hypothetical protein PHLCEN_2v3660 [Hermanssonia centrifuga]|uniref:Uncharacterized protein n=1 Tax=Hermanssonia centrifuga TaxID=98765 RepID=A0A2R6QEN0_9APHY|nr:hypothetical protein PHLCEN_2v3660 [Hermanssonia centrifuga]
MPVPTYTLDISVNPDDIPNLQKAGYRLCIAKRVNGKYTVVWWSGGAFTARNTFAWDAEFQVFGASKLQKGLQVKSGTTAQEIKLGQTVVLDVHGEMQPATGLPDKSGVFQVQNDYDPIRIGVNAKLGGAWSPIYLSMQPFFTGIIPLTPVEKVLVWFDTSSSTGTMFVDAVTNSVELDFTSKTSQSVTYVSDPHIPGDGGWIVGGSAILPSTYNVETDTFSLETPSAPLLGKLSTIINSQNSLPLIMSASVEFVKPDAAEEFVQYVSGRRPDGVRTWAFVLSASGDVVDSRLQAQDVQEDKLAITFLQDAYLGVLNSFQDSEYKKLTFEILHDYCGCHLFSLLGSLILINDLCIQLYSLVRDISNYVNDFFVIQFHPPVLVLCF